MLRCDCRAGRAKKSTAQKTTSAPNPRVRERDSAARANGESVLVAAELPVTRAMLGEVRTELLERIDQAKSELKAELRAEINCVKVQLDALQAGQHELKAGQHEMKAQMARTCFLVEEQNARNKIVFDALTAGMQRQDRHEHRTDQLEETVRSLASARPAGP